jgi:hypothetical protein
LVETNGKSASAGNPAQGFRERTIRIDSVTHLQLAGAVLSPGPAPSPTPATVATSFLLLRAHLPFTNPLHSPAGSKSLPAQSRSPLLVVHQTPSRLVSSSSPGTRMFSSP